MKIKHTIDWKLFGVLFVAGLFGVIAVFPFLLTMQADVLNDISLPLSVVLFISTIQSAVLIALSIFFGLFLGKKIGLGAPLISDWLAGKEIKEKLKQVLKNGLLLGALGGISIIAFDYLFSFLIEHIPAVGAPLWQGFLGSFYGGIVEEILMRLFLVTLLVWAMSKISGSLDSPSSFSVWTAIIIVSIVFGIGHLPATAVLVPITPLIIVRAILLNGIGGMIFGWLYWKKGLLAAMIAHFTTDIVLLVIFPFIVRIG